MPADPHTRVRVRCPDCHTTQLIPAPDVDLCNYGSTTRYGFTCTACAAYVMREADQRAVTLLAQGGVRARLVLPAPSPEIEGRPPVGPALTEDDLIEFGRALYALSP